MNAITPPTLRPGNGVLIGSNPLGDWVGNPNFGKSFRSPFMPVLVYDTASKGPGLRFTRGVVDGYEPTIGGEPMSGTGGTLPPVLPLRASERDPLTNQSWAVLVATPNAKGVIDKDSKLEIVHRRAPNSGNVSLGGIALTLIVWKAQQPIAIWPIVYFNLRYTQQKPSTGPLRHFFL